ncbi:hypothetical protein LTR36_009073 [Oleoguttula mirabilis]|uniref:Uncharacterized protein n=1 Tax=Oleoguttula mirabilis TaxID=1507867 RepID=A0AAV9J6V1_9PEZI|nr:hypothetical protein LTR36_009073 [Oleoguttula mirabilis]
MSADRDGDSRMASSPSPSPSDDDEESSVHASSSSILSPPASASASQHHDGQQHPATAMPSATTTSSTSANANGKRPIQTISNGADHDDDGDAIVAMGGGKAGANVKPRQDFPPRTHAGSGYTWARAEDEPGYAWGNKKAQDESYRAWDREVVHKECMVKNRYGDPFEVAEKEQAVLNSLTQR